MNTVQKKICEMEVAEVAYSSKECEIILLDQGKLKSHFCCNVTEWKNVYAEIHLNKFYLLLVVL